MKQRIGKEIHRWIDIYDIVDRYKNTLKYELVRSYTN